MPYSISKDTNACSTSEPFAVKKKSDGKVMGCHATKDKAQKQIGALQTSEKIRRMAGRS